ncbi:hypothetical protein JCM21900_001908 [Sporobolomyces salmonicolor]
MADSAPPLRPLVRSYAALDPSTVTASEIPAQIARGLAQGAWRLLDIVKELGESLVSELDAVRSRGVGLLSAVVDEMDKSDLDRQSTKTLTTFFTDKLSDKPSMVACVTALTGLTESPTFGTGEGMEVVRGLFSSVTLKSHPQAVRHSVYVLLDSLMSRSRPALKRLGSEFMSGYCSLVEGEKDPRNLMISFSIVRVVLLEFDISKNVEDLFDITFCYFPITFTPPPDDPYGITSDDLIVALRGCLSATPHFGKLALPLFLDKMQAASEKAKRQTLQALTACFPIYGAAVSGEWAGRFSEALSIEVFHATDNTMMELALVTFHSLFATLYPDATSLVVESTVHGGEGEDAEMATAQPLAHDGVEGVAVKVVENSLDELKEPDKNNAKPAVRILCALMASSNRLARYILSSAIPPLLVICKDPDDMSLRPPALAHLSTLLAALSSPEPTTPSASSSTFALPLPSFPLADGSSPLEPFRDDLLSVFTSGTRSLTSRPAALEGLVNLAKIPGFLSQPEIEFCVSAINDVLVQPEGEEHYDAALDGLVEIARLYPRIIEQETLPILFAAFPSAVPAPSSPESDAYRRALAALAALCIHPDLFEILSLRLSARLEEIVSASPASDAASLYAHHLLSTLRAVLAAKIAAGHGDIPKYIEKFVPRLFSMFLLPTLGSLGEEEVARDPRLLVDAGKVVNLVVQRVEVERQSVFTQAVNDAFHHSKLAALLGDYAQDAGEAAFQPFSSSSSTAQQNTVALFTASLLAMRPNVSLPTADLLSFLRAFLARSLECQNEVQLTAVVHLLANSINKRAPDVAEFLDSDLSVYYTDNVLPASKPDATRRAALRVWTWVAKGLIVRSEQRGYAMVEKVLELFHDPVLARDAATLLGVLAEEGDRVLSKENFAVIRLLYKQRFFTFLLPKLVAAYKETTGEGQAVYLIALSCLLQHIPRQLTLTELPKLLPLLVTSLDLPDPALRANVIDTLAVLVKEVPTEMDNSISSIAVKALRSLTSDTSSSRGAIKLRLASLNFLAVLPAHIPYLSLHPQKATVLKELGRAVDDPRRDVRRAAVDCRSKWFLYS